MDCQYYCQQQAINLANTIIPVPKDYPLKPGLPTEFREHFTALCDLAKRIYLDMVKQPEAYGLFLTDLSLRALGSQSKEAGLIRKSKNSVNKLSDTLFRLCQSGEVCNHQLIVSLSAFKTVIKQAEGNGASPVTKYELILSRLVDFGFSISNFNGKPFTKTVDIFTVEYPDSPQIIDTLKAYCNCWYNVRQSQSALKDRSSLTFKGKPVLRYYSAMNFDFRFTADQDKIPMQDWIAYELKSQGVEDKSIRFHVAFYEYSRQYKDVNYDGNYFYKSKRIVQVKKGGLSLKLSRMDKYMDKIAAMPDSIKKHFGKSYCNYCDFQGATVEYCKFRLHWTYEKKSHDGCAFICFNVNDTDESLLSYYWGLLQLEYNLEVDSFKS